MNYRSYSDLGSLIKRKLPLIRSGNYDLIVGIPRSGMVPAYMIALYLNQKCCDLGALIHNYPLKTGSTRHSKSSINFPSEANRILLVDDSIFSGVSLAKEMERIPEEMKKKITTLAVYSSDQVRDDIDIFLECVPLPRLFEWNIFHHQVVERAGFDIDGVLCVDPTKEQNDDGSKYIEFLSNTPPLFIPTGKIHSIVTSRLEKYREQTEAWLNNHGIQYEHLIMLDLPNKEERQRLGAHGTHKAEAYRKSQLDLFVESERHQAIKIHELTKKPVYCTETNEMFAKGAIVSFIFNTKSRKVYLQNLLKRLPKPIYNSFRYFYKLIS
ncbi:hypothetical protein I8J29_26800 [Paenibacillus sp. MWE-103]|uniref:Phosphoribosyltransferase domain-containing protein n=1 Tax=Paenibacillus artemisiicola TaxID=1172618 RepID=A0ABS3WI42_9BACL|nr:phosphoribosyltransferase family protein [Paenibacillus artemisiicola]MBO7747805.1 hypothetical protein [Paenibacillus artemisiicola]